LIMTDGVDSFTFTHDKIREVLYDSTLSILRSARSADLRMDKVPLCRSR
jgi:hypothetical protein